MTVSGNPPPTAWIRRVVGPLVEADGAADATMNNLVMLGDSEIPAEIVAIRNGLLTMQAYEYTGGLRPGDRAVLQGRPLSAQLGPGLLGGVFDGLLRPLPSAPTWLRPGSYAQRDERNWSFEPTVADGEMVSAGAVLGVIRDGNPVAYRVLVPPDVDGQSSRSHKKAVTPPMPFWPQSPARPCRMGVSWPVDCHGHTETGSHKSRCCAPAQRALDLLFPVARGGTACVPGGFGTGKTVLLQQTCEVV